MPVGKYKTCRLSQVGKQSRPWFGNRSSANPYSLILCETGIFWNRNDWLDLSWGEREITVRFYLSEPTEYSISHSVSPPEQGLRLPILCRVHQVSRRKARGGSRDLVDFGDLHARRCDEDAIPIVATSLVGNLVLVHALLWDLKLFCIFLQTALTRSGYLHQNRLLISYDADGNMHDIECQSRVWMSKRSLCWPIKSLSRCVDSSVFQQMRDYQM